MFDAAAQGKRVTWRPIATYHFTTARRKGGGRMPTDWAFPRVERREVRRQSFTTQGYRITPVARLTRIAWLGGSYTRERPTVVEVERDGHLQRLPIRDVTRLAIAALLATGVVFSVLAVRRERANNKRKESRAP
jgi:hypothetical protein